MQLVGQTNLLGRTLARDLAVSERVMSHVRSTDGTTIAYERSGNGPALILVDGALCSRAFGPSAKLAPLLARHFTVYVYDRRGRGQSGDTPPYSPAREVEDIAALIKETGGSASLLGLSSGGALALEAAATGLAISKVVAYEPPYVDDSGQRGGAAYEDQLKRLLASGNRGAAVKYFMKDMVGAPAALVVLMRLMPWIWRKLEAVAHTLPYDAAVMTAFRIPRSRFASIAVAGAGDERVEDRSQVERSCAGDRGGHPRRSVPRAGRTDAQREARRPDAGGHGVLDGARPVEHRAVPELASFSGLSRHRSFQSNIRRNTSLR